MPRKHRADQCPNCGSLELHYLGTQSIVCESCCMALVRQYDSAPEGADPPELPPRIASRAEWDQRPHTLRQAALCVLLRPVRTAEDRLPGDRPLAYIATVRMSGEAQRALWQALGRARLAEPLLSLNEFCVRALMRAAAQMPPNPEAGA